MRTECKQATFEFHGLFQRKVKARFDGGKITSDAGVLLLREVERGTVLIGLSNRFSVISSSPDYARDLNPSEIWAHKKSRSSLI